MDKERQEVDRIIVRYLDKLRELGVKPERVILYGSHARGTAREGSDIDLVVVSESFTDMNLLQRLELLGVASARIMEPVQARGYTKEEFNSGDDMFLLEILKHGKVAA